MASELRCEEVLHVHDEDHQHPPPIDAVDDQSHHFCHAYKDTALLYNNKVFKNMLELEEFYLPDVSIYEEIQDEIKLHMRKIVTEWMLDVCIGECLKMEKMYPFDCIFWYIYNDPSWPWINF